MAYERKAATLGITPRKSLGLSFNKTDLLSFFATFADFASLREKGF